MDHGISRKRNILADFYGGERAWVAGFKLNYLYPNLNVHSFLDGLNDRANTFRVVNEWFIS